MAYELPGFKFSLKAAADLSAKQYYFVKLDGNGFAVVCAAITDKPIGVLQNTPVSGEEAEILVTGITKISANGAISIADSIGSSSDGQAETIAAGSATTGYLVVQERQAAANADEIISVLIDCLAPARAA